MLGQSVIVEELQQQGQDDVDLDLRDIARAGPTGDLTELLGA
jgi:hypothetical protein